MFSLLDDRELRGFLLEQILRFHPTIQQVCQDLLLSDNKEIAFTKDLSITPQ